MSRHNTEGGLLAHLNTIEEQLIHEHGRATAGAITVGILIAALILFLLPTLAMYYFAAFIALVLVVLVI